MGRHALAMSKIASRSAKRKKVVNEEGAAGADLHRGLAADEDRELDAAVLHAVSSGRLAGERALITVAMNLENLARHAEVSDEEVHDALCSLETELVVRLIGTAAVGVSLDANADDIGSMRQ